MIENITLKNLNSIILIQKKYRFLKKELEQINTTIYFYKDVLLSMINNLSYLNNINLYQEIEHYYISILNKLKKIKDLLDFFNTGIKIKILQKINLNTITQRLLKIRDLIIKYINHIAPDNIMHILRLLLNNNWINYFTKDEINKIVFISKFTKPICIWDIDAHKKEINIDIPFNENTKKTSLISKDLLETLFGIKKNDESPKNAIIISDHQSMPFFLKNMSEFVEASPKKKVIKRKNHFTKKECMIILNNENIKITKNNESISLFEDKYGACVYLLVGTKYIVIQCLFKDDLLNISHNTQFIKDKINEYNSYLKYNLLNLPLNFKKNYLKILGLRDLIVIKPEELYDDINKKYNDFKILLKKPLVTLINEFLLASKYRKIDILTLLLISDDDNIKIAYNLFDIFKIKDKKNIANDIYYSLHYTIRELLDNSKICMEKDDQDIAKIMESDIPYERRISMLNTDNEVKAKAYEKIKLIKNSFQGDGKAQNWLDNLLKIPFGIYKKNNILSFKEEFIKKINLLGHNTFSDNDIDMYIDNLKTKDNFNMMIKEWDNYKLEKKEYIFNIRNILDNAVYGHKDAKLQLERLFAQWTNGNMKGSVIGLQGPPGTGKTSLIKMGLSKCLFDENNKPRPFYFLGIGGSVNGSTLIGHSFTYVSATHGKIVDILISAQCMNPIIFIDELDKVSRTENGREIISVLTHLTDSTTNNEFEDRYFSGIKLDLSKALIVFSFNDPSVIDPILLDRITIIETNPLTIQDKIIIIKDYMLVEIIKDIGFNNNEIIMSDEIIKYLINTYTNEAGVRKIKEIIIDIIRDINLNRFHNTDFNIPYEITKEYIDSLFINKHKLKIKKHHSEPQVGLVNGLYATTTGLGGITVIQMNKIPSQKSLELTITGNAKEIMKESISCSLNNALRLITPELLENISIDANNKKCWSIHVHCPDTSTPKDGPSAGAAFTLCFYSLLTNKKIKNDIAMTGEIDLTFNITAIGGLESKLRGAKNAGITTVLYPFENQEDIDKLRRNNISYEDETFKIIPVHTIYDVFTYALVD